MPAAVADVAAPESQGEGVRGTGHGESLVRSPLAPLPGAADFEEDDADVGDLDDLACDGVVAVEDDDAAASDVDARLLAAVDVVQAPAPAPRSPATPRGYKPGTRQVEGGKNVITGDRPWWAAPRGDKVWEEKAEQLRRKGGADTKGRDIVGWQDTGLSGGAGR